MKLIGSASVFYYQIVHLFTKRTETSTHFLLKINQSIYTGKCVALAHYNLGIELNLMLVI